VIDISSQLWRQQTYDSSWELLESLMLSAHYCCLTRTDFSFLIPMTGNSVLTVVRLSVRLNRV